MKVLVTGGSGFLGRRSVPRLVASGYEVGALARSQTARQVVQNLGAKAISGDLDDEASVLRAFEEARADVLLNIASLGFGHASTIVKAAEAVGFRHCVFVSTTAIETRLNAPSKTIRLGAEKTIAESSLSWTIIRPTMIYGGLGDRNIERLLTALKRLPLLPVPGGGRRLQQPVHADDLAQALLGACQAGESAGRIYTAAGPEPITFKALIEEARQAVNSRTRLVSVPLRLVLGLTRMYGKAVSSPRIKVEQLERLAEDKAFSIEAACSDLGFDPRPFDVGVRQEAAEIWPK